VSGRELREQLERAVDEDVGAKIIEKLVVIFVELSSKRMTRNDVVNRPKSRLIVGDAHHSCRIGEFYISYVFVYYAA
jgi:hypothetical protein